ncbi:hypothetical protein COCMIDRAFT_31296 [Bipolaris oryzae ATCC 44560]|uniref:Uncharacterized protein n=1 Tax=Bipolaris oryzae ATCC 44560 TaxID=930090 RepID=W6YPV0_COCMI|nr:uncharacterized protein COCMIDRAFT_31296 [Bipolaris oryzae ATCC 44560]EUC39548.1 hypothetical protein COCMIDRAFT_31296 [Bipolaris oryzae ATCC 44560]
MLPTPTSIMKVHTPWRALQFYAFFHYLHYGIFGGDFLWPLYFSPLIYLRKVLESGQFSADISRLYTEPRVILQCKWYIYLACLIGIGFKDVPENLVRYRRLLYFERLFVVSPEALVDVPVTKTYELQKSPFFVTLMKQILSIIPLDLMRLRSYSFCALSIVTVLWGTGAHVFSPDRGIFQKKTPKKRELALSLTLSRFARILRVRSYNMKRRK